jgi:hypothetical protein
MASSAESVVLTPDILEWMTYLDVLEIKEYPLIGAQEKRTWAKDPRLTNLSDLNVKNSDVVTYYNHIATIHHKRHNIMFIVARETMDAFLARQKDPIRYPMWLMASKGKQCEIQTSFWVVKNKPPASATSVHDWLCSIEDAFPGMLWMYDALAAFVLARGIVNEMFYGRPSS